MQKVFLVAIDLHAPAFHAELITTLHQPQHAAKRSTQIKIVIAVRYVMKKVNNVRL